MSTRYFLVAITVFLAACGSSRPPPSPAVNSDFSLRINHQFDNLPNYTRLYFQQGNRVNQGNLDKWTTWCRLHVFNREHKADYLTSVKRGRFAISSARNLIQSSDNYYGGSGFSASVGIAQSNHRMTPGLHRVMDGPPSYYLYRVEMILRSAEQPDVQTLTCSRKWSTRGHYFPTLEDMRRALGDIIEFESA